MSQKKLNLQIHRALTSNVKNKLPNKSETKIFILFLKTKEKTLAFNGYESVA
jgi:hypothetical protein